MVPVHSSSNFPTFSDSSAVFLRHPLVFRPFFYLMKLSESAVPLYGLLPFLSHATQCIFFIRFWYVLTRPFYFMCHVQFSLLFIFYVEWNYRIFFPYFHFILQRYLLIPIQARYGIPAISARFFHAY